ncbi:hypothetical protein AVEN_129035-1 [Araneus ventricosus]|uniref:Uncharacterized protein n=1 Tax=Araneus ventricosus TaxID=182803 RepID=A0A4Y2HKA4_ARAVE|nr:hypothetical protein AVEN_129035-1 [Araneus ventricosus]
MFIARDRSEDDGNRVLHSTGLKINALMMENRQQRKFKPIGCDCDVDVVRFTRYRNPVWPVVSMRHMLQTFLESVIILVPMETDNDMLSVGYTLKWVIHRSHDTNLKTIIYVHSDPLGLLYLPRTKEIEGLVRIFEVLELPKRGDEASFEVTTLTGSL